jgi:hypothetical protein
MGLRQSKTLIYVLPVAQSRSLAPLPLWVMSVALSACPLIPVYPQNRTSSAPVRMSRRCQQQTRAMKQITSLFDHLVGAGEQRRRHAEAERFSSLEVDYEIELLRPLYR